MTESILDIREEFLAVLNTVCGFFMDSQAAFILFRKQLDESDKLKMAMLQKDHPEFANEDYLQNTHFYYGTEPPTNPESRPLQMSTNQEVHSRNALDGINQILLGNLSIVFIYQLWEDNYRSRFSNALGLSKDDLKADVFGDLRYLRQSIVHNQSRAISEVEKCRLIKWYSHQDNIFITFGQFIEIVGHIKTWLMGINSFEKEECAENQPPIL